MIQRRTKLRVRARSSKAVAIGAVSAIGMLASCGDPRPFAAFVTREGLSLRGAHYVLRWSAEGAEVRPDGSFTVVNDLGYTIDVRRAYLVSHSATLVPCAPATDAVATLGRWISPREARAGHGESADPSAVDAPRVERVGVFHDKDFGGALFAETRYCDAHYVIGRAWSGLWDNPEEHDMTGTTVYVEGSAHRPDMPSRRFVIESALASGEMWPLPEPAADVGPCVEVSIERRVRGWFDGIDFDGSDAEEIARDLVLRIPEETGVSLRPWVTDKCPSR